MHRGSTRFPDVDEFCLPAGRSVAGQRPSPRSKAISPCRFTDAKAGDYFAGGAIQHLSHVILDLGQWYADSEPYLDRVQNMFRSNPVPSMGYADQFADGGGPAFLPNAFQGRDDARQNAAGQGTLGGDAANRSHDRAAARLAGGGRHAVPSSDRWSRLRLPGCAGRDAAAETALQHVRADRRGF